MEYLNWGGEFLEVESYSDPIAPEVQTMGIIYRLPVSVLSGLMDKARTAQIWASNVNHINDLADQIHRQGQLVPIVCYCDSSGIAIQDGHHRMAAMKDILLKSHVLVEIRHTDKLTKRKVDWESAFLSLLNQDYAVQ